MHLQLFSVRFVSKENGRLCERGDCRKVVARTVLSTVYLLAREPGKRCMHTDKIGKWGLFWTSVTKDGLRRTEAHLPTFHGVQSV